MSTHHSISNSIVPGTVEFSQRRIMIDGAPCMVLAGEVHYFRLARKDWDDRLQLLQNNGMDTVSTYIPWLWHELPNGEVDLEGRTHPQRDLIAFLDLCASRGLRVIARPGPFIMAELKNEGMPYRLYDAPFKQPVTWDGAPTRTRTLDYLAPDYLAAAKGWYAQVMPVLAQRLKTRGGPIIAVQLDNEIGMLSWVSNCPDLSDESCEDMRVWCLNRYGDKLASQRGGADASDPAAWAVAVRTPIGAALPMHHDLGLYMRERFRRYVQELRSCAEVHGVTGVPFLINIHGTGGGRGLNFPIGISQLFESYRNQPQMTSGSDLYLGDLTVANVADLYLANAFMLAVHDRDQPLTSMEFEVGNGNYGDDLGILYAPESAELKARLCVAQGNRLLNFYLHCGGENPPLPSAGDGIDRIAFTGQRHGFAAPVGPEGKLDPTYTALGRLAKSLRNMEHLLADSQQEFDHFALGFVPDHYLTEYHHPATCQRAAQIADLERFRGRGPRDILTRVLLLDGFSFPSFNLQAGIPDVGTLVLSTGATLGRQVQENLVSYVSKGGNLLLVGLLPDQDHDGAPCTVLADAIGLKSAGRVFEGQGPKGPYWPSVKAHGWAAPRPEVRVTVAQLLQSAGQTPLQPLLTEIQTGQTCAANIQFGSGQVFMLGCDYPADLDFYRELLKALNVVPRWQIESDGPGIVVTSTVSQQGRRLLHLINVSPDAVSLSLRQDGKHMFSGKRVTVPARSGFAFPVGSQADLEKVNAQGWTILESTAEIIRESQCSITLRPTQEEDVIVLNTTREVRCKAGKLVRRGKRVRIAISELQQRGRPVTITFGARDK
jgi:beta-galactosidase